MKITLLKIISTIIVDIGITIIIYVYVELSLCRLKVTDVDRSGAIFFLKQVTAPCRNYFSDRPLMMSQHSSGSKSVSIVVSNGLNVTTV